MGFIKYLKETQAELKFVKWPTQRQTVIYTALVIIISIITAFYLGVFDFIFTSGIQMITESTVPSSAPYTIDIDSSLIDIDSATVETAPVTAPSTTTH